MTAATNRRLLVAFVAVVALVGAATATLVALDHRAFRQTLCGLTASPVPEPAEEGIPLPDEFLASHPTLETALDEATPARASHVPLASCEAGETILGDLERAGAPAGPSGDGRLVLHEGSTDLVGLSLAVS